MARIARISTALELEIADKIRSGMTETAAAETSGVARRSYQRWKQRGALANKHHARRTAEQQRIDEPYRQFWHSVMRAVAESKTVHVGNVHNSAVPHVVRETHTVAQRKLVDGELVVVDEKVTTIERTERDWRASAWLLERRHGDEYGKPTQPLEVTGAEGGPVESVTKVVFEIDQVYADQMSEAFGRVRGAQPAAPVDGELEGGE